MIRLLIIFIIVFMIYYFSSTGETPYNYFTRLSQNFVSGKLYLDNNRPWLNELIPIDGKYFVVYPPMPAFLMTPITFLFGGNTSQTLFSIFLGSFNVVLVYLLLRRLHFSEMTSLLVAVFFGFGTNHWYLSSIGSAWFIAHIVALFFLLLALIETFGKHRLLLTGLLIGASFWARTPVIFTIPFFYIYLWKKFWPIHKKNIYNFIIFNLGILLFILLDTIYNFLRFGNLSPFTPYYLIPNISNDPVFKDGFMSLKFIPRHIDAIFLSLPKLQNQFPYLIPSLYSTAIWFTSPALIYIFKAKKILLTLSCWIAILSTLSIIMLWAGVGYAQFGYRFAQDFMPFLVLLVALGIGQRPTRLTYLLVGLSMLVNLWGIITINFLNIWVL